MAHVRRRQDRDNQGERDSAILRRYFGDGISGSAYVLYYQAVDLDLASLGLKPPTPPVVSDVVVSGIPEVNGGVMPDFPEPALPPGLGYPHVPTLAPTVTPAQSLPPILNTPLSPSLSSPPLIPSEALPLPTRKSLPTIRIPDTSDSTTASPTPPVRTHGGLSSLRTSPSSSKIRPSAADGIVTPPSPGWKHRLCLPSPPCSSIARNSRLRRRKRKRKVWTRKKRRNGRMRRRKADHRRSLTASRVCGSSGGASSHPKTSGKGIGIKTRVRLPFLQ